jgi:hypothetical protein
MDFEHFLYFLTIWSSSFEKALYSSIAHFFIGSLILWDFTFWTTHIFCLLIPC